MVRECSPGVHPPVTRPQPASGGPASAGAMADYVLVDMFAEAVTGQRTTEQAMANAERRLQRYYR